MCEPNVRQTDGGQADRGRQDKAIDTADLFADRQVVQIRHDGQIYSLRVTKNGKLILTK
jgi:hemin uptake protein HemP